MIPEKFEIKDLGSPTKIFSQKLDFHQPTCYNTAGNYN